MDAETILRNLEQYAPEMRKYAATVRASLGELGGMDNAIQLLKNIKSFLDLDNVIHEFECIRQDHLAAFSDLEAELSDTIKARNPGRRRDGFLCTFSGKDADLLPEGFSGIKAPILYINAYAVMIVVSGYKTFCCSGPHHNIDRMQDVLLDALGDVGDVTSDRDDEYIISFKTKVTVPFVMQGEIYDIGATADAAIERAREVIGPYQESWAAADIEIEKILKET